VKRFRGGLVCKAHRLLYHSTLGLKVKKKKMRTASYDLPAPVLRCLFSPKLTDVYHEPRLSTFEQADNPTEAERDRVKLRVHEP